MGVGCEECDRLRREYASAIAEHIRLEDRLKRAALAHDQEKLAQIIPKCEEAAEARKAAREAVKSHQSAHNEAASA